METFFVAQPFQIIVGYPPGAGYDLYARILSRHLGAHLPGNPKVIVQNMPGAGSLTMANHLYNAAKADGSTIGTFSRGITMLPIVDPSGVRYDPLKFKWIGAPSGEVSVAITWGTTGLNTFADLQSRGMTAATSGPASDGSIYGRVLNSVLGTKIKTINGYQGSAESMMAIERGEVEGATAISYSSLLTAKRDWLSGKRINIVAQHALKAHPQLPNVPVILDFAKTDEDRRLLEVVFARQAIGYPYAAPPGVPADRVAAIRTAFINTLADKSLLADAERGGVEIDPVSGQELQELLERIYSMPADILDRAKSVMQPG